MRFQCAMERVFGATCDASPVARSVEDGDRSSPRGTPASSFARRKPPVPGEPPPCHPPPPSCAPTSCILHATQGAEAPPALATHGAAQARAPRRDRPRRSSRGTRRGRPDARRSARTRSPDARGRPARCDGASFEASASGACRRTELVLPSVVRCEPMRPNPLATCATCSLFALLACGRGLPAPAPAPAATIDAAPASADAAPMLATMLATDRPDASVIDPSRMPSLEMLRDLADGRDDVGVVVDAEQGVAFVVVGPSAIERVLDVPIRTGGHTSSERDS